MAKYHGTVGYAINKETAPGVYRPTDIVTAKYSGDIFNESRTLQASDGTNDDINISSQISIVADPFAYENYFAIVYAEYMGVKWKVTNVKVQHPRLVLTLGGVYNG